MRKPVVGVILKPIDLGEQILRGQIPTGEVVKTVSSWNFKNKPA